MTAIGCFFFHCLQSFLNDLLLPLLLFSAVTSRSTRATAPMPEPERVRHLSEPGRTEID